MGKKTCREALSALLIASLLMPAAASAIGIAPALVKIDYEPGFKMVYSYYARAGPAPMSVKVSSRNSTECDFTEYIKPSISDVQLSKNEIRYFDVTVELPDEPPRPGLHKCAVIVEQTAAQSGGGVSALSAVAGLVYIYVPYPEKYIEATLSAPNVNIGEPVAFRLDLISRGLENLTASSTIKVTDLGGRNLATLYTEGVFVESREGETVYATWDTEGVPAGSYKAEATIEYGGDAPAIAGTTFKIGDMLIKVTNVTYPENIYPKDIAKILLELDSYWNSRIEDAYVTLGTYKEGILVGTSRSESFNIDAWESRTVPVFWDTAGLEVGAYDLNFTVHYSGITTDRVVSLEIKERPDPTLLMVLLAALLIAAVIAAYAIRKRRKKARS